MSGATGFTGPKAAIAAVKGGSVTRERLIEAAAREGRGNSPLVRSLAAQSLPSIADLARAYAAAGGALRLDDSFIGASLRACRLLDPDLLRRMRCVPVELLGDLCILAVEAGSAERAVATVRDALHRDVLPVLASPLAIDRALAQLGPAQKAARQGPLVRRDSPVHARFRDLVLEDSLLESLPMREEQQA